MNTKQVSREEMKEYGDFFRFMRESIGYTRTQMAKELGIFRTTLSRWEKGIAIPHQDLDDIEQRVRGIVKSKKK